ncbi:peptidoglycan-binding domain-containing protein [Ilumatobacter coccineus]|uniref:Peptidoglycan binding-like domain-containing protein n=1 Tax=Ilumatobacter coccineus (strain NBRC 103263 / KCTC 29153 / YM16-304) TaxID=1313172 RepID=A0A6C7E1C6_ILUCY|nr:peptidoglycan-binding domain-containing protein [Ilumatobacter coccineus]BAN00750.1 hypothetical protein YM304_04360 [Ilumatobacter coccineus YM16-304]
MNKLNTINQNTTAKNIITKKARLAGSIAAVAVALTACGGAQSSTATESQIPAVPAVAEQAPAAEQTPAIEQAPAVEEAPTIEEASAVEEVPAVEEAPAVEQTPAPMPIVEEAPAVDPVDPTPANDVADAEFDDSYAPTNGEAVNQLIPASSPDFPCVEYIEATELPLFPCSKGELVVQLQHDLQWNGTPHTVDGYFGEDTYLALQGMQSAWGMYPTGIMDQAMETVISYIYSH